MKSFLETWRPVVGYEGLYEVSDFGEVRSLDRWRGNGKGYFQETRVKKPVKQANGYLYVGLYKDGKPKMYRVHRLVAQAFIENPYNLPEVNHIDEDKTNNVVSNLEWCDRKYNINHGTGHQRSAEAQRGVKRSYVAEALGKKVIQMTLDGVFVKEWESTKECGRNGFNQSHVCDCCNGKRKTHKGYRWVYAEDYYKQVA